MNEDEAVHYLSSLFLSMNVSCAKDVFPVVYSHLSNRRRSLRSASHCGEDRCILKEIEVLGSICGMCVGVADGHGGVRAVEYFSSSVPECLLLDIRENICEFAEMNNNIYHNLDSVRTRIQKKIKEMDEEFVDLETSTNCDGGISSGTTLCICMVIGCVGITVNVGDSRSVGLSRSGRNVFITKDMHCGHPVCLHNSIQNGSALVDHFTKSIRNFSKPSQREREELRKFAIQIHPNDDEYRRLVEEYGLCVTQRVNMGCSLGDSVLKLVKNRPLMYRVPDIDFFRFDSDEEIVIVVASDGIWGFLTDERSVHDEVRKIFLLLQRTGVFGKVKTEKKKDREVEEFSRIVVSPEFRHVTDGKNDDASVVCVYLKRK